MNRTGWKKWLSEGNKPYFILAFLIIGVYWPNFGNTLSYMDDDVLIKNNEVFFSSWENLPKIFMRDVFLDGSSAFYRPMQSLTYFLDFRFFVQRFGAYFFTNLILHSIFVLLIRRVLSILLNNHIAGFFWAAIFAVHPLFVQTTSWLPGRGELLLGIFALASLIKFHKFAATGRYSPLLWAALWFFAALLSKETAVLIPAIIALSIIHQTCQGMRIAKNRFLLILLVIFVTMVFYTILRLIAVNQQVAGKAFDIGHICSNLQTIPELIGKFFLPIRLSPLPRHEHIHLSAGLLCIFMILAILWRLRLLLDPVVLLGGTWYLLFSLPALTFVQGFSAFSYEYLEQRAYVPTLGLVLICGRVIAALSLRNVFAFTAAFTALSASIIITLWHTSHYKNSETFFSRALEINPGDALAHFNRGNARHRQNQFDDALTDYNAALEIHPHYRDALNNRGIILAMRGEHQKAISDFSKAIELKPTDTKSYLNRGISRLMNGDRETGCTDILTGIETDNGKGKPFYEKYCLGPKPTPKQ